MAVRSPSSVSEEEFHSLSEYAPQDDDDDTSGGALAPPVHPVPSMQAAFEESIAESTQEDHAYRMTYDKNAEKRRRKILEAAHYDDSWVARWKQRAGSQHHPLLKLIAQIAFGMYLLQQGQAQSDEEVIKILQTHVNEVDAFLERTSEDFDVAIQDIEERTRYLKLPMQHMDVFQVMLDGKRFRTELLVGNEKITKIIRRTTKIMHATMYDVHQGIQSTKELGVYLNKAQKDPHYEQSSVTGIFEAMRGNEQGWLAYLDDLGQKARNLSDGLIALDDVVRDIARLAAAANARNNPNSGSATPTSLRTLPHPTAPRSRFAQAPSSPLKVAARMDKPLPKAPVAKPHPVPFNQRYEQPRQAPYSSRSPPPRYPDVHSSRGRPTGGGFVPRESRTATTESTRELAEFLKETRPPGASDPPPRERQAPRSKSPSARDVLDAVAHKETRAEVAMTMGQGAVTVVSQPQRKDSQPPPAKDVESPGPETHHEESQAPVAFPRRKDSRNSSTVISRRISRRMKRNSALSVKTQESLSELTVPTRSSSENGTTKYIIRSPTSQPTTPLRPMATHREVVSRNASISEIDSAYSSGNERQQNRSRPSSISSGPMSPVRQAGEDRKQASSCEPQNKPRLDQAGHRAGNAANTGYDPSVQSAGSLANRPVKVGQPALKQVATMPSHGTPRISIENRPPSRLGLFPALTPTISQSSLPGPRTGNSTPGRTPSAMKSLTGSRSGNSGSGTNRAMSFKKFFHVKKESNGRGMTVVASKGG